MTVGDIQSQVQLLTHHDNLDAYVLDWVNRTLQDISTTAIWHRSYRAVTIRHTNATSATSNNPTLQMFEIDPGSAGREIIEVLGCADVQGVVGTTAPPVTYHRPLVRRDWQALQNAYHGLRATEQNPVNGSTMYAVVQGSVDTTGGTVHQSIVGFPFPGNVVGATISTGQGMRVDCFLAPSKLPAPSHTFWIMQYYPKVVLAGVMMRARLFLRDGRGYLMEKAEYVNGLADMILKEENTTVNKPYLRAVQSDEVNRRLS